MVVLCYRMVSPDCAEYVSFPGVDDATACVTLEDSIVLDQLTLQPEQR